MGRPSRIEWLHEGCSAVETQPDCTTLSVEACTDYDGCTYSWGRERTEDLQNQCYTLGESTPIGCLSANEACEPVVLNVEDPDSSSCYQVVSGCTPPGWGYCSNINTTFQECTTE